MNFNLARLVCRSEGRCFLILCQGAGSAGFVVEGKDGAEKELWWGSAESKHTVHVIHRMAGRHWPSIRVSFIFNVSWRRGFRRVTDRSWKIYGRRRPRWRRRKRRRQGTESHRLDPNMQSLFHRYSIVHGSTDNLWTHTQRSFTPSQAPIPIHTPIHIPIPTLT